MFLANEKMREMLFESDIKSNLPNQLKELINPGFTEFDGCTFLRSLGNSLKNVSGSAFPDKTGYECFINSVHMDEYTTSEHLSYSLTFVNELFANWRVSGIKGVMRAIISLDEFDALIKFHIVRDGESWISDDLESYEEAILVIDSTSNLLSKTIHN